MLNAGYNMCIPRYYINYKFMKKKVKQYSQQIQVGAQDRRNVLNEFSRVLDNQVCDMFISAAATHIGSKI